MRRTLGVIGGVGLGLTLSQFPEFSQQYEQRLGGAVDELRIIVTDFDADAAREGLNREQALDRYEANTDTFIVGRGADMAATIARYERLSQHLVRVQNAGPIEKLSGMAEFYDAQVAARAWENYEPAVPVTPEGVALSGIGILGGYSLVSFLTLPFRRRRQRRTWGRRI